MALLEMAVRHARITANDYTLGDSDGLTLNVTASGGKSGSSATTGQASRSACPWIDTHKCPSKKRVHDISGGVPKAEPEIRASEYSLADLANLQKRCLARTGWEVYP